jgi:hypothetical protein
MAIQKAVRIMVWARADGASASFTLNLNNSAYWVGTNSPSGAGGAIVNWFAGASPSSQIPPPVAVVVVSGADSASIVSPIVTVNVPVRAAGAEYNVVLDLLFA